MNPLIGELEATAADAWPAAVVEHLDGWRLRYTENVTRRANSVWPNANGGQVPLPDKLNAVEAFYARRNVPARYQICPAAQPRELDHILAERGYVLDAPTSVQTASLTTLLSLAAPLDTTGVRLRPDLDEAWFTAYGDAEPSSGHDAVVRRSILARIAIPHAYGLLAIEGAPAAVGVGVCEGAWLGIFCMATLPAFRRRGAATAVLRRLAEWGEERGATGAYLQVMQTNAPACALYARLGFTTLYGYHYREAPG